MLISPSNDMMAFKMGEVAKIGGAFQKTISNRCIRIIFCKKNYLSSLWQEL
jgi:hypothetical protein